MLDAFGGHPAARTPGVPAMLGRLFRILSLLLLGWFVFVLGAVAYAAVKGRETTTPEQDADEIDLVTTFGELRYASTAPSFRGGRVTTWFAGGTLDLRGARLDLAGATLRTQTAFGGGNLVVPDDWRVESKILPVFGGVSDQRLDGNPPEGGPTLRLEGVSIFGGWVVTSEAPGEELVTA